MGSPKQLLDYQGKPLIVHAMEQAIALGNPVTVVLGAHAETIRSHLSERQVTIVKNLNWQEGLSSSLRLGIQSVSSGNNVTNRSFSTLGSETEAALVMLADQPWIPTSHLLKLLVKWHPKKHPIVATEYHAQIGVPAIFGKQFFEELLLLTGDRGAKKILKKFSEHVKALPCPEAAFDWDTPDDLKRKP